MRSVLHGPELYGVWTLLGLALLCHPGCTAQPKVQNAAPERVVAPSSPPASGSFVTYDQVDDSLTSRITSVRYRITYKETDMWRGAPRGALVTIVDFADFECPFCRRLAGNLHEVLAEYPDDVRLVVKHFPLDKHPDARRASEAVLAAHAQGKGFEMYEIVFDNAHDLTRDDLIAYATEAGVPDMVRLESDLDDRTYAPVVDADIELGRHFRVRSTPSFFINGKPVSGAKSVEELRRMVEDERISARKLVDAGSSQNEVYARIMRAAKTERWATW